MRTLHSLLCCAFKAARRKPTPKTNSLTLRTRQKSKRASKKTKTSSSRSSASRKNPAATLRGAIPRHLSTCEYAERHPAIVTQTSLAHKQAGHQVRGEVPA